MWRGGHYHLATGWRSCSRTVLTPSVSAPSAAGWYDFVRMCAFRRRDFDLASLENRESPMLGARLSGPMNRLVVLRPFKTPPQTSGSTAAVMPGPFPVDGHPSRGRATGGSPCPQLLYVLGVRGDVATPQQEAKVHR